MTRYVFFVYTSGISGCMTFRCRTFQGKNKTNINRRLGRRLSQQAQVGRSVARPAVSTGAMARLNSITSCRATAIMPNTSACNFTRRRYNRGHCQGLLYLRHSGLHDIPIPDFSRRRQHQVPPRAALVPTGAGRAVNRPTCGLNPQFRMLPPHCCTLVHALRLRLHGVAYFSSATTSHAT